MSDPNFNQPEWDMDLPDAPFRSRVMQIGGLAGGSELAASLFEIDPGGAATPYHLHHGIEEMLLVLSGSPLLRTPEGSRTLEPGAVVVFPRGEDGAHRLTNPGTEPARFIIVGTTSFPDVAEHLDTGATLVLTGPQSGSAFPGDSDIPPIEAVERAMRAAP